MNTTQKIINLVLVLGIIALFTLQLGGSKDIAKTDETEQAEEKIDSQRPQRIAYIRTDSLVNKYEYHKGLQKEIEGKIRGFEKEFQRRTRIFQENVQVLEEEAPRMTKQQLERASQELKAKEMEIMQYREEKMKQISEEEERLNKIIFDEVYKVIDEIKEERKIDFVFMWELSGSLLWAEEKYNITELVAEKLNARHEAKQKEKK